MTIYEVAIFTAGMAVGIFTVFIIALDLREHHKFEKDRCPRCGYKEVE